MLQIPHKSRDPWELLPEATALKASLPEAAGMLQNRQVSGKAPALPHHWVLLDSSDLRKLSKPSYGNGLLRMPGAWPLSDLKDAWKYKNKKLALFKDLD